MNDIADALHIDPALAGAWQPAAAIRELSREISGATGMPVRVRPAEKANSPGWCAFLPDANPPGPVIDIGADFWPEQADVVLSHELLHLAMKTRGYPAYVWADREAGYLGIPLHSAFEHPLIVAEQRRRGIAPDAMIRRDLEYHGRIILPFRRRTEMVAPECLLKAAIMIADRTFWGCDLPTVRKAAKVIDESRACLVYLDVHRRIGRFAANPSPEAMAEGMAACMVLLDIDGRGMASYL